MPTPRRGWRFAGTRAVGLGAAALLLGACSTVMYRGSGYDYGLRPGEGLAILTLSMNGVPVWPEDPPQRDNNPPFQWLIFARRGEEKLALPQAGRPQSIGGTTTVAFHADLLPGTYRLHEFVLPVPLVGNVSTRYSWTIPDLGEFEVQAGKVTNLGHLVFHEEVPGQPGFALALENDARVRPVVLPLLLPKVSAEVRGIEPLAWKGADWGKGADVRRSITARSEFVLSPRWQGDGSILAGSCVGQVLERSPAGAWRRYDTGVSYQIRSVMRLGDRRLLAGGELGVLRLGNAAGQQWSAVDLPFPGVVEWLGQRGDGSVLVLAGDDKATALFGTSSIDAPAWSVLARIEHPRLERPGVGALRDARIVQQRGDLVSILFADGKVVSLDATTATFLPAAQLEMLRGFPPLSTSIAADDSITVLHKGIPKQALSLSRDRGASWRTTPFLLKSGYVTRMHFASSDMGFRYVLPSLDAKTVRVQTTADAGRSWRDGAELPHLRYLWELGDGRFLGSAERRNGRAVWLTEDAGQTWKREELPAP